MLEELCWSVRMGAHLIADPGEGEIPLPPLAITAATGNPDPLEALSHSLLSVVGLCIDDGMKAAASPRCYSKAI